MARGVSQALIDALSNSEYAAMATLFHVSYPPAGHWYQTDYALPVTDTGPDPDITYQPGGELLDVGPVKESGDPKVNSLTIKVWGAASAWGGALLGGNPIGWRLSMYRAALNADHQVIGSTLLIFRGSLTGYKMSGGSKPSYSLEFSSHWANFEAKNGRLTNPESQALHFPTAAEIAADANAPRDKGFDFAPEAAKDIKWGSA